MKNIKTLIVTVMGILLLSSCNEDDIMVVEPNADLEVLDMVFASDDIDPDSNDYSGNVTITGIVVNTGTTNFVSGSNQQTVELYQEPLGGTPSLKNSLPFTNLNAGDTLTISYTTPWNVSIEFPPSFRVALSYDPDIFIDGNPNNDDKNLTNNSITKTGFDINNSF